MSMEEMAENIGLPPPPDEIPLDGIQPEARRTRNARPLKWYERQYGAGFVAGLWIGIAIGVPLDAILAVAAKWFVMWLGRF